MPRKAWIALTIEFFVFALLVAAGVDLTTTGFLVWSARFTRRGRIPRHPDHHGRENFDAITGWLPRVRSPRPSPARPFCLVKHFSRLLAGIVIIC